MAQKASTAARFGNEAWSQLALAGVSIDPTILIQLITQIIQMLMGGCKKSAAEALTAMQEPTRLMRIVERMKARELGVSHSIWPHVEAALDDQAALATADDTQAIYDESK
jgi:hypothetical protein